jgi:CHAT domain-containing protein
MGPAAATEAFQRALEGLPAVIHYTGHGRIVGNEEVLVLGAVGREGSSSELPTYFGRRELQDVKNRLHCPGSLLGRGPLVVLNSCLTGRMRQFGGQREDLAWAFLEEGADAVIASGLPVLDDMGAAFSELLYFDRGDKEDSRGMAWRFAAARAFVERVWRDTKSPYWPAWSLFTYHGNPYAHLPHIADGRNAARAAGKENRRGNLFARMAKAMGLRDGAEAERTYQEVRSRLG